ncbi:hypothetical protein J7438_08885 [Thalassotalea sp. G20_0]|uniref:hypothetical protein n=1 Tax=Thalassotalea sp. G20_0 TaxID=2821093 RepID=UPI001ADC5DE8|nr:hypothetical protein [Thalassotalea sp. G20_0]MBO9494201.1 hypothetical protein [Thalassotalea sp. G20_0]
MIKKALASALIFVAGSAFANGSKSTGDSAVPVVPCYVKGELINSMPINICFSKYQGSTTKKASMQQM